MVLQCMFNEIILFHASNSVKILWKFASEKKTRQTTTFSFTDDYYSVCFVLLYWLYKCKIKIVDYQTSSLMRIKSKINFLSVVFFKIWFTTWEFLQMCCLDIKTAYILFSLDFFATSLQCIKLKKTSS